MAVLKYKDPDTGQWASVLGGSGSIPITDDPSEGTRVWIDPSVDGGYSGTGAVSVETAALYGLEAGATPDDVFNWLGKYNTHWWRYKPEVIVEYRERLVSFSSSVDIMHGDLTRTLQYSKSINIDQTDGTVTLADPQEFIINNTTKDDIINTTNALANLAPVYITNCYENESAIYYLPEGATAGHSYSTHMVDTIGRIDTDGSSGYEPWLLTEATKPAKVVYSYLYQPNYKPYNVLISGRVELNYSYNDTPRTIQYSKSIDINQTDGTVTLVDPQEFVITTSKNSSDVLPQAEALANLAPVYITNCYSNESAIYYIPEGATAGLQSLSNNRYYTIYVSKANDYYLIRLSHDPDDGPISSLVRVSMVKGDNELTFVHSKDINAYPHCGIVDGIEYEYTGIPFENIAKISRIAYGNYIGTGTYGEISPNILSFDFAPKFIFINYAEGEYKVMFVRGMDKFDSYNGSTNVFGAGCVVTWGENSVSWYTTKKESEATCQGNAFGKKYYWVAIG